MKEQVTPERILGLGLGFMGSKVVLSAVELGLFTELAKGPLDADALAQKLNLHPRGARDFFDALVALGMLERQDGFYANTREADQFLDREKPSYIGGLLEMANAMVYPVWSSLTEGLRSGRPQNEIMIGGGFDALYSDQARLKQFLHAMTGVSMASAIAIAQKFPWQKYQTFIDVGCAEGGVPVQVALAHGHLSGGGFDLPPVQPIFEEYVASFGLSGRLKFHPGDFFAQPLPQAEVLIMGHILHDWNLEQKKLLLSKAYEALPQDGALIVYEAIIDDERKQNAFGLLISLDMLLETPGGFDYTGSDCCSWMQDVGFRQTYVEHLAGPESMVVGIK
ncbi:MAG TPA: methyltransferase [Dehalococcoidia bacterium]|nr:methyltransferase [Dehalococcoidia bacterium]